MKPRSLSGAAPWPLKSPRLPTAAWPLPRRAPPTPTPRTWRSTLICRRPPPPRPRCAHRWTGAPVVGGRSRRGLVRMRLAAARRLLLDDCEHVAQPVVAARGQKLLQLCDLDDLGDIEPPHLLHAYAPEPLHPRGRMPRATRASASPSTPTTRAPARPARRRRWRRAAPRRGAGSAAAEPARARRRRWRRR